MWFGGHLYVGYVGLLGYVLLTALALGRSFLDPKLFKLLTVLGYVVAVGGTIISIGLQFYSYFHIRAMCKWCFTSAVTMTVTLVVYALLYQFVSDHPEETTEALSKKRANLDFIFPSALLLVLALGMLGMRFVLVGGEALHGKPVDIPAAYPLVPPNADMEGDPSAPILVVEFADLNCPSCQINTPKLKQFVQDHQGKIKVVYRHFPLPMHKTSELASAIDEYASEKGKFWAYTLAVMGTRREIEDPEDLYKIAQSINLDVDDIKKRLGDSNDPIYKRLADDQNLVSVLGIGATPTFILQLQNGPAKKYGAGELFDALNGEPYSKILQGK
jgi:protein-disulfide isomerase